MFLRSFKNGSLANLSFIVADEVSKKGVVIDPTGDTAKIIEAIQAEGITVAFVLNTHGHPDHVRGNGAVLAATGAKLAAHRLSNATRDLTLDAETVLDVGALSIRVIHTPGHTPDSVCFLVGDDLFTGDTLFVGECGRTDLAGGDARAMYDSLFHTLGALPDRVRVHPGHDYGPRPNSTLGEERQTNYVLRPRTREEFVVFMAEP